MVGTYRPTGGLVDNLRGSVSVISVAAKTVGAQLAFVVPAEQCERRMVPQADNIVLSLFAHILDELWVRGVDSTSELKILPN